MTELRQYIYSVVSAALVCGILSSLVKKGGPGGFLRILCSFFLVLTVIRPFSRADFSQIMHVTTPYKQEGVCAAATGTQMAQEAKAQIIKQNLEAYILDKAIQHNADLCVAVTLNDDHIPIFAELSGEISPYAKQHLQQLLISDLGIAKENQLWTG